MLVAGLLVQAFGAAPIPCQRPRGFYTVAFVFGSAYGGTMPFTRCWRAIFQPRILGTVLGAATVVSSLGMALGPLIGGWLFDRFGSYAWLYIGSMMAGLAAAGIATMFPRTARAPQLKIA